MAAPDDLNTRIHAILSGPRTGGRAASSTLPRFSPYDAEDVDRASEIASRLVALAKEGGGDVGLAAATQEVERLLTIEKPGLAQYAFKLFLAHRGESEDEGGNHGEHQ